MTAIFSSIAKNLHVQKTNIAKATAISLKIPNPQKKKSVTTPLTTMATASPIAKIPPAQKVSIAKAMAMAATAISLKIPSRAQIQMTATAINLQIPNRTQIPRKMPILLLDHAPRHPNRSPEVPLPGFYCCCAVDLPLCADA